MFDPAAVGKELKDLYSGAITESDLKKAWQLGKSFMMEKQKERCLEIGVYAVILPALWARYHLANEFGKTEEDIFNFYTWAEGGWISSKSAGDVESIFSFGYLLSTVESRLLRNIDEAKKIIEEMYKLLNGIGDTASVLKVITADGLVAEQRGDYQGAIDIFSKADDLCPDARNDVSVQQHLANIWNNCGLSRLNLSDKTEHITDKRKIVSSAIRDLNKAARLYMKVDPPPLKHIRGVGNRLIMSAIKLLLASSELEEEAIGKSIAEAFSANDRKTAIGIILGIVPAKANGEYKVDGDVLSKHIALSIRSIQGQLRKTEEFLSRSS
ncbi:MAG: hypothetical protein WC514_01870 [Candidatus Paceibacterota bacterium]